MASVKKRIVADDLVRWDVFYRDPDGRQHRKAFERRAAAARFASTVEADKLRGTYLDPDAGRVSFKSYADGWLAAQTFDPSTREAVELRLRLHAYPTLGSRQLRTVRPSTIQAWLRSLEHLSASYRRVIYVNVASVFAAAVDDELLAKNPCRAASVSRPRVDQRKVIPWERDAVVAVRDALPERYQIVATLAAGLGLRQGEVFGLSPDDVDFLRGRVEVRRQVKLFADGSQVFALPKGRKVRTVPLPGSVRGALAAYLARFPAQTVTLPYEHVDGPLEAVRLVVTSRESKALSRNYFNGHVWKPALRAAGVPDARTNGLHGLRHWFASVLLDAGESIKAVSEYLGHTDAGFTLRTYTHLMPSSEERSRRAVDAVLRCNDDVTGHRQTVSDNGNH